MQKNETLILYLNCNIIGDEVLEWNNRSLVGKTYDEVHDIIVDSRHDLQVELRVSRSITAGVSSSASPASALPSVAVDMGRGATAMHLGQDSRTIGPLPHPRVHPASSPLSSSHPSSSYHASSHHPFSNPSGGIGPNVASTGIDAAAAAAAAGTRPAVMVSDPLGGTRMLNPNSPGTNLANPLSTRIQVRPFFLLALLCFIIFIKSYSISLQNSLRISTFSQFEDLTINLVYCND